MSQENMIDMIDMVGPPGLIKCKASEKRRYERQGYKVVHLPSPPVSTPESSAPSEEVLETHEEVDSAE